MSNQEQPVASLADLPKPGAMHVVERDGQEILLCRSGDTVYAVENLCTHAAARLCEGRVRGDRVFCPLHGAAFDIRNGEALSKPATVALQCFDVEVRDGEVYLVDSRAG